MCDCMRKYEEMFREFNDTVNEDEYKAGNLISLLQTAQGIYGYISQDMINYLSEKTRVPAAKIYGVATFYAQFRLKPTGRYIIMLCQGTACHVNGAEGIEDAINRHLGIGDGETTEDGLFTLDIVVCLGCCSLAPVMMIRSRDGDETYGNLTKEKVVKILDEIKSRG